MELAEAIRKKTVLIKKQAATISAINAMGAINNKFGTNIDGINLHREWMKEVDELGYRIAELQWFINNRMPKNFSNAQESFAALGISIADH